MAGPPLSQRLITIDYFKEPVENVDTATHLGGVFTILAPFLIAAYVAVLLALFLTRPVVVSTIAESSLFTAPWVWMSCRCNPAETNETCVISDTFLRDNSISSFCSDAVAAQNGPFPTERIKLKTCYAIRSSEATRVEVPKGCRLIQELESRTGAAFNFSDPKAAIQTVWVDLPYIPSTESHWIFHRLREVHKENELFYPYFPALNLTYWWGVSLGEKLVNDTCSNNVTECSFMSIGMEAVFNVFIHERLGDVWILLTEMGGAVSLIFSVMLFVIFAWRQTLSCCCPKYYAAARKKGMASGNAANNATNDANEYVVNL